MDELMQRLRHRAADFADALGALAYQRGLAVTALDGSTQPIPITATPVVIDPGQLRHRAELTARLSSAGFKMARAILQGDRRELLAGALSPIERMVLDRTALAIERLATTRVDFFVAGDRPWALELNTTIPAMQGYSDIAADSFIEAVGRAAGLDPHRIRQLQTQNGSNALALYHALLEGYRRERNGELPRRIALLCRRNDAQLTELRYLRDRFTEWGTETDVVHPDELSGDDAVRANGRVYDLVYRHLFVRRLETLDAPYLTGLFCEVPGRRAVLLNPPNAQVEVKTTFALLSQATLDPALARQAGLTEAELEAISASVPWTRNLRRGPATGPDGAPVADLVARVAAEPDRFVLKRAWDYGGKAVFVGQARAEASFQERTRAAFGAELAWPALVDRAAEDPVGGGFVVQERVPTVPESHLLCVPGGGLLEVGLYVDFSAYASVNLPHPPAWGGVCRGSPSQIVNILGGGGVLPLVTTPVAGALLDALRA